MLNIGDIYIMAIIDVKYATPDNNVVIVTHDDGRVENTPWPCNTYHKEGIQDWIDVPNTIEDADVVDPMIAIRSYRGSLLSQSDWTQLADTALSAGDVTIAATYRQDLRDVPADQPSATIDTVVWPTKPSFL